MRDERVEGRWREKREDADKAAVNRRRDVSAPLPSPLSRFPWFSNNKRQVYPRGDGRAGFLPPRQKILPCFFRGGIRGGEPEAFRSSPLNPTRLKRAIRNQAAVFLFARPTIKRLPSIEKRGIFAMEIESRMWSKISRLLFYYLSFEFYYAWIYRAMKRIWIILYDVIITFEK